MWWLLLLPDLIHDLANDLGWGQPAEKEPSKGLWWLAGGLVVVACLGMGNLLVAAALLAWGVALAWGVHRLLQKVLLDK